MTVTTVDRPAELAGRRPRKWAAPVANTISMTVVLAGAGMIASSLVDLADGGPDVGALLLPGLAALLVGALGWWMTSIPEALPVRTVFGAIAAAWLVLSLMAAVPYLTSGALDRVDHALFEGVSGVTTTGATVIADLDGTSSGLLFWRALTQWFGGLGVIILAVAILPFLGAGGMSLLRSELPGPAAEHLAPRVRDTLRRLWGVYVGFTVIMTSAYLAGGMSPYDAATHAFTTVSTGGFSTRPGNLAAFDSPTIEWIAVGGMLVAGTSFVLLWRAVRGRPGPLLRSAELRAYVGLVGVSAVVVSVWNATGEAFDHETIRRSIFAVVSVGSTTGFTTVDWGTWIDPAQALLLFLMLIGGMTGSTAGGSKVLRLLTAASYARREIRRHVHPRLVGVVRIGREVVPEEIVSRILGFHALFFSVVVIGAISVAAFDVDIVTSLSVVVASVSNVGPGLGDVAPGGSYLVLDAWPRALTIVLMLLGRLEIYPLLLGGVALVDRARSTLPPRVSRAINRRMPA